MEDKLDSIFSLQKGLTGMMNLDRYPKDMTPFTLSEWRTEKTNRSITRPELLSDFSGSFSELIDYL